MSHGQWTRSTSRVVLWVCVLGGTGLGLGILAAALGAPRVDVPPWVVPLLAAGLVTAGSLRLGLQHRGEREVFNLFEAALAPVLFFLPGLLAVAVAVSASAICQLRLRMPPLKATFNVAQWAASTAAGAVVLAALDPPAGSASVQLSALLLAMLAVVATNTVAVAVLFALLDAQLSHRILRLPELWQTSSLAAVNVLTGLLLTLAIAQAPIAAALLHGPLLLLHRANRGYALERASLGRLRGLQQAVSNLETPLGVREGIPGFLGEVLRCFDARAAELVTLRQGDVTALTVHHLEAGPQRGPAGGRDPEEGYRQRTLPLDQSALYAALLSGPLPTRLSARDDAEGRGLLGATGWRDCLAVPLRDGEDLLALLVVYERSGLAEAETGDLLILEALGREMAAALLRSRLLDVLLDERGKLARIVEGTTLGIASIDGQGRLQAWNRAFELLTGYPADAVVGQVGLGSIDAHDLSGRSVTLEDWAGGLESLPEELRIRTSRGARRWLACSYARTEDADAAPLLLLLARDVTELRLHRALLAGQPRVLESIARDEPLAASLGAVVSLVAGVFEDPEVALFVRTDSGKLEPAAATAGADRSLLPLVVGVPAGAGAAGGGADLWRVAIRAEDDGRELGVLAVRHPDPLPMHEAERMLLTAAAQLAAIAIERDAARNRLAHQATHDALTTLPNRTLFLDRCVQALTRAARTGELVAVLFLDLDRFKSVNDNLGHEAGNQLLAAVAHRVRSVVRPDDVVARFGGDEFTILCERISDLNQARAVGERVQRAFSAPFVAGGQRVAETASIGIAVGGSDSAAAELVENADAAMYRAKAAGGDRYQVFDAQTRRRADAQLATDAALRRAVAHGDFAVLYQPTVSLNTGRLVGVEALVRWQHPRAGLLPPSAFLGVAEETGLIVPLGMQVLRESLRQLRQWQTSAPHQELSLAVNLSPRQLCQPDLVPAISAELERSRVDGTRVAFEIPESVLRAGTPLVRQSVRDLKKLGVSLSVDDVGAGSSLSSLRGLPVDAVKVDRSVVAGMSRRGEDERIVSVLVKRSRELGLTSVAEGVETTDQVVRLQQMRCDVGQGYYFGGPLPPEEILPLCQASAS